MRENLIQNLSISLLKNIENVDKVIINDAMGNEFELHKNDGVWTDKDKGCIPQESANFVY